MRSGGLVAGEQDAVASIRLESLQVVQHPPARRHAAGRLRRQRRVLSISTEVKKEKEEKSGGRVLVKETYFGSASRGFSLPNEIDDKSVVAKLEDGVLKLTLPKRDSAVARSIAIQ